MRLWSLHPRYLDAKGLTAVWREALLARKVLQGGTRGYRNHPQLIRFRKAKRPIAAVNAYLKAVFQEAFKRGYCFDAGKIGKTPRRPELVSVTQGQLDFEVRHLLKKLKMRDPFKYRELHESGGAAPHPIFRRVKGGVASWEKQK